MKSKINRENNMRQASQATRVRPWALLLAAGCLAACQSTNPSSAPAPAPEPAQGTQELDVQATGATATVDGDTIRLEYPESEETINDIIPEWVINPAIGGVTASIGVAAKNDLGVREQLDEARLNGRLELASMLELRVQRAGRTELEQDIRVEGGQFRNRSRRDTLGVDRNILDMVLAGSRQRALWFDVETGEVYVWMVLDGAVLKRVDHKIKKDVSVFVANAAIAKEYRPDRKKPEPPTVIVNVPQAPVPEPIAPAEPEPPKTPIEELESTLRPIETIPVDGEE